jgi:zinc/manganese transport system permease protein
MIDIFLIPIALLIILVMIHSWFGIRILERGIIFTDLAIGQLAALGAAVSYGYFHGEYIYFWTLAFAFMGALLITLGSHRKLHLEAYIGLLYVLGASGIMMVLAQSAEGMEHFKSLLANDILFTTDKDLYTSSAIYALIALVIYFIYPKTKGVVKELLFFSLLAVTVTSSVQLAGVFVVFTLLIAPAMVASMQTRYSPLLVAFGFGWFFSIAAVAIGFYYDLPTGYSIVFLGALLSLIFVLVKSSEKESEDLESF